MVLTVLSITTCYLSTATEQVEWHSYNEGISLAESQDKPVMIDFYTDWCYWCDQLDENTYSDSRVINKSKSFVCIKVNGDYNPELVTQYNIEGYPTVVFADSAGKEIHRVVGYENADAFLEDMDKALGKTESKANNMWMWLWIVLVIVGVSMFFVCLVVGLRRRSVMPQAVYPVQPSAQPQYPQAQPQQYLCPFCSQPLNFIQQYQRWYCYTCQRYI